MAFSIGLVLALSDVGAAALLRGARAVCAPHKIHKQHSGLNEIDGTGKYTSGMLEYLLKCDEMIEEAPLYEREMEEEEEELELDDD